MSPNSNPMVETSMAPQASPGETRPAANSAMAPSTATPVRSSARPGSPPRIIPRYTKIKTARTNTSMECFLRARNISGEGYLSETTIENLISVAVETGWYPLFPAHGHRCAVSFQKDTRAAGGTDRVVSRSKRYLPGVEKAFGLAYLC